MRDTRSNREQLLNVLEVSLNEIYMFDAESLKFTYVNKGALRNIGYTMEQMSGMTPLDIKPEFDRQSFGQLTGQLRNKEKEKIVFETVHKRADGSLYDVEVHLQLADNISPPVFMAIILDISERKKAEEEKKHLAHVLEMSLNEIYMFDAESLKFTYVNKGALRNIGYTMEQMSGMTPLDIKPEFDRQSFGLLTGQLRNKEKEKIVFETVHKRADGSLYDVEVHLQLVDNISPPVYLAIILDISERKAVENEILRLNENLENKVEERTASLLSYQNQLRSLAFQLSKTKETEQNRLASFLHDNLGQILAVCKMELSRLKKETSINENNVRKLNKLIEDAIRFTRELMMDLKPAPSAGNEDLESSIRWVAEKMKKYGLQVTVTAEGRPKQLTENIRSVATQSVQELLFNVLKHADVNQAEVTLTRHDSQVEITVTDQGKGFKPGSGKQAPGKVKGFGLFNLKEQMQWLDSSMEIITGPGKGTRVKMLFPVEGTVPEKSEKASETPTEEIPPSGPPDQNREEIRVLIADDHQIVRSGLCKGVNEQDDMTVIAEASNGKEAVQLTRRYSPDVILMDIIMPEMNGVEATRQIRHENLPTRIIGLTINHSENQQYLLESGASVCLSKSDTFETLYAAIRSEADILKRNSELQM